MSLASWLSRPLHFRWRGAVAGAALVAGGAHVPVIAEHLREAPYMGVLFLLLTIACGLLAAMIAARDSAAAYLAAAAICGTAVAGYVATRSVAFPQLADDVGNWLEPLGIVAIASEAVVVVLAVTGVRQARVRDAPGLPRAG